MPFVWLGLARGISTNVTRSLVRATVIVATAAIFEIGCGSSGAAPPIGGGGGLQAPVVPRTLSSVSSAYKNAVLSNQPIAYYRLDELSGSIIHDSSSNSHSATLSGSASYGVTGALLGDSDTAMGFNGSSTHIVSSGLPVLGQRYTIEAWFKTTSTGAQHVVDLYPQQLLIANGHVEFGPGPYIQSPQTYADNHYHHVVATLDLAIVRLYVDGAQVAVSSSMNGSVSGATLNIGHYYGGGSLFNGNIDEVAVYSGALNAAQVLAHFQAAGQSVHTSPSPSPEPTATAESSISTKHTMTGDYVGGASGTSLAASLLGPWLSWAETDWPTNPLVRAAGIKAMIYSDPNRTSPGDPLYPSQSSAFAHTCSGSRITTTGYSSLFLMDPSSSAMRTAWKDWIAAESLGEHWDAVFDDDANDVAETSGTPCHFSASAWLSATEAELASVSPAPIVYNGLQLSGEINLNGVANVLGGMEEGCYSDSNSIPNIYVPYWTQIENTEIAMGKAGKLFMCLGRDNEAASSATSISSRIYTYASFLLTYSPTQSVLWESYDTASGFHVEPESKLVALNPLV